MGRNAIITLLRHSPAVIFHRWLDVSLRTLFVICVAAAAFLGVVVLIGVEQREAVKAIEAAGCEVVYYSKSQPASETPGSHWLRELVGDDCFQRVYAVQQVSIAKAMPLLPHFKRLRRLNTIWFTSKLPLPTLSALKAALPHCNIRTAQQPGLPAACMPPCGRAACIQ
jgi:hypothetical protein